MRHIAEDRADDRVGTAAARELDGRRAEVDAEPEHATTRERVQMTTRAAANVEDRPVQRARAPARRPRRRRRPSGAISNGRTPPSSKAHGRGGRAAGVGERVPVDAERRCHHSICQACGRTVSRAPARRRRGRRRSCRRHVAPAVRSCDRPELRSGAGAGRRASARCSSARRRTRPRWAERKPTLQ